MQAKGTFTSLVQDPDTEDPVTIRFMITTYGTLGDMCDATGPEFNPMEELDYAGMPVEF